jgi:hypothetical protein
MEQSAQEDPQVAQNTAFEALGPVDVIPGHPLPLHLLGGRNPYD